MSTGVTKVLGLQEEVDGFLAGFGVLTMACWRASAEKTMPLTAMIFWPGASLALSAGPPQRTSLMVPSLLSCRPSEYQTLGAAPPRPFAAVQRGLLRGAGMVCVDELVAAALDAVEVGVGVDEVDAVVDEGGPVVGGDLVEVGDELLAVVGDDERAGVAALAEEDVQEVGEGLLVVGELADEGVGVEPEELAFLVVVLAATPVGPGRGRRRAGCWRRWRCLRWSASRGRACSREWRRRGRAGRGTAAWVLEAGAGGEDVAHVLRHAFVDPEERALLQGGEVGLIEVGRDGGTCRSRSG